MVSPDELRIYAPTYAHDYPESFAAMIESAARQLERLRSLARAMLENDPDDMAADGVTCLDVWRKEAKSLLEQ